MKNGLLSSFLFLVFLFSSLIGAAQTNDTLQIRQTALNYIEGFYTSNAERMAKALSPELAKRVIVKDQSGDAIQNMGYSQLLYNTRRNKNQNVLNPDSAFRAEVIIYDIDNNIAMAKVITNKFKFIDYLHLGRFNGEWKIINVLWEFR
jgi:Putative lumazine-binding